MEEKIGINIKEASDIMGISKQLMTELTKLKDFPNKYCSNNCYINLL